MYMFKIKAAAKIKAYFTQMNKANFFEKYFTNAVVNSIIIMDCDGTIEDYNQAFVKNFGYNKQELLGKNFSVLFSDDSNKKNLPEQELANVIRTGQAHDENYLLNKNKEKVWCIGEAILVENENGDKYIIKDFLDLQNRKQIDLFLANAEQLLESLFTMPDAAPMMILDSSMKIQRVNQSFLRLFELSSVEINSNLHSLGLSVKESAALRSIISNMIVTNKSFIDQEFSFTTKWGIEKVMILTSKIIYSQSSFSREVFIIFK